MATIEQHVKRFHEEVVVYGDFTRDWFTAHIPALEPIMRELEGRRARVLEIGSFEGLSACYFLWRLPESTATCVDTFLGTPGTLSADRRDLDTAFDRNLALVDATRVRKLVGDSRRLLLDLAEEGSSFDLVYVDGSHRALDVLVDAALSWQLVPVGGVIVFDDYRWAMLGDDRLLRPGPAIDAFLDLVSDRCEILFRDRQVAIRRIA
jgi:predicted O-methyltransferase YrrM